MEYQIKNPEKFGITGRRLWPCNSIPSQGQQQYIDSLNQQVIEMFEAEGFKKGPIWIETFYDGRNFVFNEMGYRFGGSMTYHDVKYLTGVDQIGLLMDQIADGMKGVQYHWPYSEKTYCIAPIHMKSGLISEIEGCDEVGNMETVHAVSFCHVKGDRIEATGIVSQVFVICAYC